MVKLPVIVGFGGFNAAGRSSFHQSYQRMVIDSLPEEKSQETIVGLATMMGMVRYEGDSYLDEGGEAIAPEAIVVRYKDSVLDNTLVRRISKALFDVDSIPTHHAINLADVTGKFIEFTISKKKLPSPLPTNWEVLSDEGRTLSVRMSAEEGAKETVKASTFYESSVKAAGQLPDGFNPGAYYKASHFHPRGLQMSILGASDAVNSMGIDWQSILQCVSPDQVAVYSSSVMSQLDDTGLGGLFKARLNAGRVTTKQLALGLGSMPADFVNAYVLGSMGATASIAGACATFLYNLQAGVEDIRSGRRRVVLVGSSEAPVLPEVIDGYATMSALATDEKLCKLDGVDVPDYRHASRPFGENCGFTIAESTQYIVLMDDALAIELGANIHGAVSDVFVNADGYKKSISSPGPGNYLTFAKAVASARNLLGDESVRQRSFVQAHGSSTPQNRVTESQILDRVAGAFGIQQWPITAVKSYVGHSLAPASGDQLVNTLGIFAYGILPGIKTIDSVATDVLQERLSFSLQDRTLEESPDVAFLNSKGFGGNNATACVLSPQKTMAMLSKRYGGAVMSRYRVKNEQVELKAKLYHQSALQGNFLVKYHFGENMIDDNEIELSSTQIRVPGFGQPIDLAYENLYKDMI